MSSIDPLSKDKSESEGRGAAVSTLKEKSIAERIAALEKEIIAEQTALIKMNESLQQQDEQQSLEFSPVNKEGIELLTNIVNLKNAATNAGGEFETSQRHL